MVASWDDINSAMIKYYLRSPKGISRLIKSKLFKRYDGGFPTADVMEAQDSLDVQIFEERDTPFIEMQYIGFDLGYEKYIKSRQSIRAGIFLAYRKAVR